MQWVFLYNAKKFQLKFSMHGLVGHNQNLFIKKKCDHTLIFLVCDSKIRGVKKCDLKCDHT